MMTTEIGSPVGVLEVSPDEIDRVELRAEEVREFVGGMPRWTARAGTIYLAVLVVLIVSIAWLIEYPDVIVARVTLPAARSTATIVGRVSQAVVSSGRLRRQQQVSVRFSNPHSGPYEVPGTIQSITPSTDAGDVAIRLDHELTLTGGTTSLDATIVTRETRLLLRLLSRLRA